MLNVKVGDQWLAGLRLVDDLALTWRWPGGCFECSWTVQTNFGWRDASLAAGQTVEVFDAGFPIWFGILDQPDWESGEFTARGLSQQASSFPAFDGSLNPVTTPTTAITTAVTQFGWLVATDGASVPSTPLVDGDVTNGINQLDVILDAAADEVGKRWGVDEHRTLYFAADAATVSWHIIPGVVELGQTNVNYRSDIFLRYTRDTDNAIVTQRAEWPDGGITRSRYGFVSQTVDVTTSLGPISTTRAAQVAGGILDTCAPQPGWTNAADVQYGEILTPGGEPVPLSLIRENQMVRLHGVYDDVSYLGVAPYLDVVLGEVKRTDGDRIISLSPVDAIRDDLAAVIEDLGGNAA